MTAAIILAGGLGTRLHSIVSDRPKPMALVKNKPFLQHQMEYWIEQGVSRFILSVGYKLELIVESFGDSFMGVPVEYSIESTPMGTGGGLLRAASKLNSKDPFLLLNGDTYFDVCLGELKKKYKQTAAAVVFSSFESNDTERYMGLEVYSEKITGLNIKPDSKSSSVLVNGGVYLMGPRAIEILSKHHSLNEKFSLETTGFTELINAQLVMTHIKSTGNFIDIGVPEDFLRAQHMPFFNA